MRQRNANFCSGGLVPCDTPDCFLNFGCKLLLTGALSARKLTYTKVQNITRFHSRLYYVHSARGNAKNETTGVPARITTGRGTEGPENGTYRQKQRLQIVEYVCMCCSHVQWVSATVMWSSNTKSSRRTQRLLRLLQVSKTLELSTLTVIVNKSSAVAEMGDRGHNRHAPKRVGCCAPFADSCDRV